MPDRIYIVVGECGEYSDWRTWDVAAYLDKEAAELHAQKAREGYAAYIENQKQLEESTGTGWTEELPVEERNLWDFYADNEYGGSETRYSVEEVMLCAHPDQYMERMDDIRSEAKFWIISHTSRQNNRSNMRTIYLNINEKGIHYFKDDIKEATKLTEARAQEIFEVYRKKAKTQADYERGNGYRIEKRIK